MSHEGELKDEHVISAQVVKVAACLSEVLRELNHWLMNRWSESFCSTDWSDSVHQSVVGGLNDQTSCASRAMMMTACDLSAIAKPWEIQSKVGRGRHPCTQTPNIYIYIYFIDPSR